MRRYWVSWLLSFRFISWSYLDVCVCLVKISFFSLGKCVQNYIIISYWSRTHLTNENNNYMRVAEIFIFCIIFALLVILLVYFVLICRICFTGPFGVRARWKDMWMCAGLFISFILTVLKINAMINAILIFSIIFFFGVGDIFKWKYKRTLIIILFLFVCVRILSVCFCSFYI